jgi:hypothetical protein
MSRRAGKGAPRATAPAATPAIYYKTPVTPVEAFQAVGRLRKEARDEIDRLIRFLDKTDDYVSRELEDSIDDNPHDEETDDKGEDNEDADPAEPSLGSVGDMHLNQERWAAGGRCDLEQGDGETGIADQDGLDEQVPFRMSAAFALSRGAAVASFLAAY